MATKKLKFRSTIIFIVILVWAAVVTARLFYWQVLSYERLATAASRQHFASFTIPPVRGDILASDGSILVTNQPAFLVYAQPNIIADSLPFAQKLAPVLDIPESSISARIQDKSLLWSQIATKVDEDQVDVLKKLDLKGLGFEKIGKRYYPEASLSAHLLGFVGLDNQGQDTGYFGIEGYYDNEIRGRDGYYRQEKDPFGLPIIIGEGNRINPVNGRTLKTHIDKVVQFIVEEKLKKALEKYGAKGGTVVIMDPATGAILTQASLPSYEQANYYTYDKDLYKNPAVANTYEPGSTFKVIIMSAALNEDAVKPNALFPEEGPVKIAGYTIRTWDNKYHGKISLPEILQYSSNVGMVQVQKELGVDKTIEYLKKFGFGSLTNIDLEDEAAGTLRESNDWKEIDLATVSFGQGIAVTPIQMVRAVAVIANGGKLVEPHVVDEVIAPDGTIKKLKPKVVRNILKESTAQIMTEMMIKSVESGEAHYKIPKGFKIAGKTGTAQIPVAGHYDSEKTIASFVGFAPAYNPKFVMLITLTEPGVSPWGSETAAPLFMEIAQELFLYYKLSPA